jgi:hypothetical protein
MNVNTAGAVINNRELTVPATEHERNVLNAALESCAEQIARYAALNGVNAYDFIAFTPNYERVLTADEIRLLAQGLDGN